MATRMNTKKYSKRLSLVLRHAPEKAGLVLGEGGWLAVDDLLTGLKNVGWGMSREMLEEIVTTNDKKRFTLSPDGQRIRAAQGHSVDIVVDLEPIAPPETLYHGTATRFLDVIMAEGLKPMSRQHVHLSLDIETATKVGQRHGKPVILTVASGRMHEQGHTFYRADNGVWLSHAIAPEFLHFE